MANKRVIEYPEILSPINGDYLLVDNNAEGTRKMKASALSSSIDVLYSDSNGAAHLTPISLPHNINDYDMIYMKVSNPTDVSGFNIFNHVSFMPIMVGTGEKVSVQALYSNRVMDVDFDDGDTFEIVRTDGDYRTTTIYEIVGIKL